MKELCGRGRGKGRTCAKDTTSRGLCVRVRPPHTSSVVSDVGEGEVVSKDSEVGEEERGRRGLGKDEWILIVYY